MLEEAVKDGVIALVRAMATDAWPAARKGVLRLFRGRNEDERKVVANRLDRDAARVSDSDPDQSERVRGVLETQWQARLQDLVELNPGLTEELRALEGEIRRSLPSRPDSGTQINVAREGGQVFAAQNGSVTVNQLPPQPPDRPLAAGPETGAHG
ncbi:hypothetical protein [Nocardiopsis sp. NPDC058789]|uniref:Uncharacterized protein n=1 Tax=Nocardiopsis eucommiae TaxID=2831970 RepID=A0A975L854_9ACTN|nr:hypothetical protein KGD82_20240 [Nocardiopsis eucommiae]